MTTPRTIKELRKALPGWHIGYVKSGGVQTVYASSGRKLMPWTQMDNGEHQVGARCYDYGLADRRKLIAAVYAAAKAWEEIRG